MQVFILIIVCFYTIMGIVKLAQSINEEDANKLLASIIIMILGTLAIIFQSFNL